MYHLSPPLKLFGTTTFCDWTTPSTRNNVHRKTKKNIIVKTINSLLRSESNNQNF